MIRFILQNKKTFTIKKRFYYSQKQQQQQQQQHQHNKYTFKDAITDLNLKWTIPTSLVIGLGLWFYIENQLPNQNQKQKQLKIDEPLPPTIILNSPEKNQIFDPSTNLEFPVELIPENLLLNEPLRLIGLGVRTVSFLGIKVYVAGFYVDPRVLRALRVIPGWNDDLNKDNFLQSSNNNNNSLNKNQDSGETLIGNLLNAPVHFAIRIAPVRATDFTHLRDGFCRSIMNRIEIETKKGKISEIELQNVSESINKFKSFFPSGLTVPKGKSLILIRTASQRLIIEYDGKKLGELNDSLLSNQLFLAYFADKDPISPLFKESVAEGFSNLYKNNNNNKS